MSLIPSNHSVFFIPTTSFHCCSVSSSSSSSSPCFIIALCRSVCKKVQWSQVAALKSSLGTPASISRSHSFSESTPPLGHVHALQHSPCPEPPPHSHEEPPRVSTGPDDLPCVGSYSDRTVGSYSSTLNPYCVHVYKGNWVTLPLLAC